jgi:hypothetical protein
MMLVDEIERDVGPIGGGVQRGANVPAFSRRPRAST